MYTISVSMQAPKNYMFSGYLKKKDSPNENEERGKSSKREYT